MWIDAVLLPRLLHTSLVACLLLAMAATVAAQEGQYRSRVMISPDDPLGQDSVMSVEELEKQINSIAEPYAKSSAGRHLARHYVQEKQYDKAVEYYRTALSARGLSDIANREMLRELAQVYLLQEDYRSAVKALDRALAVELVPEVTDFLLLAQANYRLKKYVAVVAALDRIGENNLTLDATQMRQALALYYGAGAFEQSAGLLRQLLQLEPENPQHWHQLGAVYLQQGKQRKALDHLALAWEKGVPFTERDLILLADLQAVNANPYGAAELLQTGLRGQGVEATGANYRKLFQFWLQAREQDKARAALQKAAGLSGDPELYLYLAQLQMEQQEWQGMEQTLLAVCSNPLAERHVGKANLFLGVSRLKQGDSVAARRLFINATLIGGAQAQAAQWLSFMEAEPATEREVKRIVSPCYDAEGGKRASLASLSKPGSAVAETAGVEAVAGAAVGPGEGAGIQTKQVRAQQLYYLEYEGSLAELMPKLTSQVVAMGISLVKSGGSADGAPLLIFGEEAGDGGAIQVALPTKGRPRAGGRYRTRKATAFNSAYLVSEGSPEELVQAWAEFARDVADAGYQLSGERRIVFPAGEGGSNGQIRAELQLVLLED